MAINRVNYQVELAARKSKAQHLNLQTSLLSLPGKRQRNIQNNTSCRSYLTVVRIFAILAILTGFYFILF